MCNCIKNNFKSPMQYSLPGILPSLMALQAYFLQDSEVNTKMMLISLHS